MLRCEVTVELVFLILVFWYFELVDFFTIEHSTLFIVSGIVIRDVERDNVQFGGGVGIRGVKKNERLKKWFLDREKQLDTLVRLYYI